MRSGMKVGIVGCGAIGSAVAKAAAHMDDVSELRLFDIDPDATALLGDLPKTEVSPDAASLLADSDVIIECANKGVVQTTVRDALAAGKKAIILTVGAMADETLREELVAAARGSGGKIYIPSGAVMGIDGVRAAAEGGMKAITLVTTKPLDALAADVDQWTILFNGSARDAVQAFPKNVNVAATLSLAGLGFDETWVQVVADPLATRNSHKIIFEGNFGRAKIEVENLPSPENPKTSALASLSTIALLRRIVSPLEVGA